MTYADNVRPVVEKLIAIHKNPKSPWFWVSSVIQWSLLIYVFVKFSLLKSLAIFTALTVFFLSLGVVLGYFEAKHTEKTGEQDIFTKKAS